MRKASKKLSDNSNSDESQNKTPEIKQESPFRRFSNSPNRF